MLAEIDLVAANRGVGIKRRLARPSLTTFLYLVYVWRTELLSGTLGLSLRESSWPLNLTTSTCGLARGIMQSVRSGDATESAVGLYAIVHVRYALCDIHKSLLVPGGSGFTQGVINEGRFGQPGKPAI